MTLLRAAPWLRAPVLAFRQPVVVVAVVAACAVLAAAAATPGPFVTSVRNAALHRQLDERCPPTVGLSLMQSTAYGRAGTLGIAAEQQRAAAVAAAGGAISHTLPSRLTMSTPVLDALGGPRLEPVRLLTRTGFADHIDVIADAGGEGVWITDSSAARTGLSAGDDLTLAQGGATTTVRVRGVYADLNGPPLGDHWCGLRPIIYPPSVLSNSVPPPLVLADLATYERLSLDLRLEADVLHELPLDRAGLSAGEAAVTLAGLDDIAAELVHAPVFEGADGGPVRATTELSYIVPRAEAVAIAVGHTVGPVGAAGTLVALLLVGAAGTFWAERRRREVVLLAVRGVSPGWLGVKAVLEVSGPAVAGAVLGWAVAVVLVKRFGPSPMIGGGSLAAAGVRAVVAVVAGVALLGAVGALRSRAEADVRRADRRRRALRALPWELAVLVAAAAAARRVDEVGPPVPDRAAAPDLDVLLIAFPMLFLVGASALGLRLARRALPRLRRRSSRWRPTAFLAMQRLTAAPQVAVLLAGAASLSVGVVVYAATVTHTVEATFTAKLGLITGGDVGVELVDEIDEPPAAIAPRSTIVHRYVDATVDGREVTLLAVDPDTVAGVARWDARFADRPLPALLDGLGPLRDGAIPALVVAGSLDRAEVVVGEGRTATSVTLEAVGHARWFPGMEPGDTTLVVDRAAMSAVDAPVEVLLWSRAPAEEVGGALDAAGVRIRTFLDAARLVDQPVFYTVVWTFGYLRSIGVLCGAIAAGGLLLYLETRQRSRIAGYVLARRMGLTRRQHRRSVALEVGASLLAGATTGAGLGAVAARVVAGDLDPAPYLPPGVLFGLPVGVLAGAAAASGAAVWLGAVVAQRAADRTQPAEVMRLGA